MDKLDYNEHFDKTEEDIRVRDAKNRKVTPPKESGRSVFEIQRQMKERSDTDSPEPDNREQMSS